jgi:two-component system, NarL family, sensor kinase
MNESGTVHVHLEKHHFSQRLAGDQEITAYRIIQELVNNSLKHAEAKNIIIQLSRNGNTATIVVEDDGKGFDTDKLQTNMGAGYNNIEHRVNYMKGNMDLRSESGKGTSVLIEFPAQ